MAQQGGFYQGGQYPMPGVQQGLAPQFPPQNGNNNANQLSNQLPPAGFPTSQPQASQQTPQYQGNPNMPQMSQPQSFQQNTQPQLHQARPPAPQQAQPHAQAPQPQRQPAPQQSVSANPQQYYHQQAQQQQAQQQQAQPRQSQMPPSQPQFNPGQTPQQQFGLQAPQQAQAQAQAERPPVPQSQNNQHPSVNRPQFGNPPSLQMPNPTSAHVPTTPSPHGSFAPQNVHQQQAQSPLQSRTSNSNFSPSAAATPPTRNGSYQNQYNQGQPSPDYQQMPPPHAFQQAGQPNHPSGRAAPQMQMPQPKQQTRRGSLGGRIDRIDPKQIPRPVESKSQQIPTYYTRSGASPPPAASDYVVVDEGNCSPRYIRLTTNNFAHQADLIEKTKLCIGAIIQPLAAVHPGEEKVQYASYPGKVIRCSKCHAYINPFFKFVDGGASFICNMCGDKNPCPQDFQCNLDANGHRRDRLARPELCRGSVEFKAGPEFIARPIQDPCYLFVLDVSYGAIVTGLVESAVEGIRNALTNMQDNPRIRVGIITYDTTIHFYSLKPERAEPHMHVCVDVEDTFVPVPAADLLAQLADPNCMNLLESLLDMIPSVFDLKTIKEKSANPEQHISTCAGAALQVAVETLKERGGKILHFQSYLADVGAGKLENRDDINLYNTNKEKTLFVAQNDFYQSMGTVCAENAITVEQYVCANSYVDLATIGVLSTKTGGQIFMYPGFNSRKDGEALYHDVERSCTRTTGWDGVMIVRCSKGLRVAENYGNFYHRRATEMDLPSIDCDKSFGVRIEHEGKLKDKTEACLQCALLYTTMDGERVIRVHTISVPVTSVMSNIFRFSDLDAIVNLSLKQSVRQIMQTSPAESQTALTNACVESLFVYRKYCASATSSGQLILPEPLKLLPLCTLGLIKHPLFQEGIPADQRTFLFSFVTSMPTSTSVAFVCPRLFSLNNIPAHALSYNAQGQIQMPTPLTLSSESLQPMGVYLLDNGRCIYMWIGDNVDPNFHQQLFTQSQDDNKTTEIRSSSSRDDPNAVHVKANNLIQLLRGHKATHLTIQPISRSRNNMGGNFASETLDEATFYSHLIEDGVARPTTKSGKKKLDKLASKDPNTMSYIDFLCYIHKRIQSKFY